MKDFFLVVSFFFLISVGILLPCIYSVHVGFWAGIQVSIDRLL